LLAEEEILPNTLNAEGIGALWHALDRPLRETQAPVRSCVRFCLLTFARKTAGAQRTKAETPSSS
jgi:hypothetical protein